jgi:hypothetical protein
MKSVPRAIEAHVSLHNERSLFVSESSWYISIIVRCELLFTPAHPACLHSSAISRTRWLLLPFEVLKTHLENPPQPP